MKIKKPNFIVRTEQGYVYKYDAKLPGFLADPTITEDNAKLFPQAVDYYEYCHFCEVLEESGFKNYEFILTWRDRQR
jgi:hypothetical protein